MGVFKFLLRDVNGGFRYSTEKKTEGAHGMVCLQSFLLRGSKIIVANRDQTGTTEDQSWSFRILSHDARW